MVGHLCPPTSSFPSSSSSSSPSSSFPTSSSSAPRPLPSYSSYSPFPPPPPSSSSSSSSPPRSPPPSYSPSSYSSYSSSYSSSFSPSHPSSHPPHSFLYPYYTPAVSPSASTSASAPDPCPFCQFRAADTANLLYHVETEHIDPAPPAPAFASAFDPLLAATAPLANNAFAVAGGKAVHVEEEETVYVLCPEGGCEEHVLLLDLQTHMDFHSAEDMGMEQSALVLHQPSQHRQLQQLQQQQHRRRDHGDKAERQSSGTAVAAHEGRRRGGEQSRGRRRGEKPDHSIGAARDRDERKQRDHQHNHHHHSRPQQNPHPDHRDPQNQQHRRRRRHSSRPHGSTGEDKAAKVSFISPPSRSRSPRRGGLSWFGRAALIIAQHQHGHDRDAGGAIATDQRGERAWLESRGSERRSRSLRRSDGKRSVGEAASPGTTRRSDSSKGRRRRRRSESRRRSASARPSASGKRAGTSTSTSSKAAAGKPIGSIRKLGKSDLGPYAHEAQMPDWLREQLERGGRPITVTKSDPLTGRLVKEVQIANEVPDLIPTIALLSERDPDIERAFLCHDKVKHVGKQHPKEGGFCGYRNIQMMISYIQAALPRGSHPFDGRIPTILRLQELIEGGWAMGINSSARLETGGIRGTRKYIGTSEAQTLLTAVGLNSRARAFVRAPDGDALQTQNALLSWVEDYFESGLLPLDARRRSQTKVMATNKPPVYFQHSGHSMTIVGLEKWRDGSRSLLVFDPFFSPGDTIRSLAGAHRLSSRLRPDALLKVYRRKMHYLAKYKEFEVIALDP